MNTRTKKRVKVPRIVRMHSDTMEVKTKTKEHTVHLSNMDTRAIKRSVRFREMSVLQRSQ